MDFSVSPRSTERAILTHALSLTGYRALLIIGIAVLILLKIPTLLPGRLWAEDGYFLQDALRLPWWQALVTPHTGYIDVIASGAMLIAIHVTDLEHVAMVSITIALLVQLCPPVLLLTSRCDWLRPRWAMAVAILTTLTPPIAEEIWLNPVTSQYHMMICTAFILAFRERPGAIGAFRLVLLAIAGLTGPGPALAAPLFWARAWIDRSRQRAIEAATLSAGVLIEIAMIFTHPEPARHLGIDPWLLLQVFYIKHIMVPFFGPLQAQSILESMNNTSVSGQRQLVPVVVASIALLGMTASVVSSRAREVRWMFAAGLTMMALSYFGALGGQTKLTEIYFGARYYYTPQVLLSLTLIGLARTAPIVGRRLAMLLSLWLLCIGVTNYAWVDPNMAHGPLWEEQIALWRSHPDQAIVLWPRNFQVHLP